MKNIIFLENTQSWPKKFTANNTKVELLAKGLQNNGNNVTIINSLAGERGLSKIEKGIHEGIQYYSYPQKSANKLLARIVNLRHFLKLIKQIRTKDTRNIVVMGGPYYLLYLFIVFALKRYGFKSIVNISEWAVGFKNIGLLKKVDSLFFNYTFGYFCDGIFPISSFIKEKTKRFHKKSLLVPVIADFSLFDKKKYTQTERYSYFLYCASTAYSDTLDLIIDSYMVYQKSYPAPYKLILVLSGSDESIMQTRDTIKANGFEDKILVYNKISYEELIQKYINAKALLIPLENNVQNIARFPQKIAEYLAAGRPIITNRVGEVSKYFDESTAYIAANYSTEGIADQMKMVMNNPRKANEVGLKGKEMGYKNFDFNYCTREIDLFLDSL